MRVKSLPPGRSWASLGVIRAVRNGGLPVNAENRLIRLRNETIIPPPKLTSSIQTLAAGPATSGLFLVQFNGPLQPAWREQLRSMRVELLRYVPDDAFVARFDSVGPSQLNSLSFV